MCGINGVLRMDPGAPPPDAREITRTREAMATRGPDGAGVWTSPRGDVGLAHRRLAIIDLSPAGHQPMGDPEGRYWITYNGEIYNYRELRAELLGAGVRFRSHTDTEVILALFAREGRAGLGRLRGMFALALWDEIDRTLVLARDPNGIKPLYYSVEGGYVRFASQARALLTGGALSRDVDPAGLAGFLFWGSVPDPQTLWRSIRAVPAGSAVIVRPGAAPSSVRLEQDVPAAGAGLAAALTESIRAHLVADVPVAVFLSSGIDSALLAAVAARHLDTPPVSVTLRFAEFAGTPLDEGPLAARIAGALGLRHVDRLVGRDEFASEWPRILESMDQPSVDGVNTYFVCKAGREAGVKCALSGTGGDELLGGYASFVQVPRLARRTGPLRRVPALEPLWRGLAGALLARRVPKAAGLLRYGGSIPAAYFLRRAVYLPEELPALLGEERAREAVAAYDPVADMSAHVHSDRDAWAQVAELESTQYLRNQLLRDCDWASMAHSLEIRVPFVDARLQAAARAAAYEPARSEGKAAVLRLLAPDLPSPLFTRRKTGFATPAGRWLAPSGRTARAGISSRRLALRVLNHFGIEVAGVPA